LFEPGYIKLHKSGELARRAEALEARLMRCDICPRQCFKNRIEGQIGFCQSGALPIVSSYCAHHGEEPVLSGTRGSGTIFFGNCNMRCVFCQNHEISQNPENQKANEISCHALAERMLYLQEQGCHNINLVSPSHFVPQIVRALVEAVPMGLRIPLVYNTGSFDFMKTLEMLDGIIDIYLPDIKYASDRWAMRYSGAPRYVRHAREAIKEMYRQVGDFQVDENGVAERGVIVRHLVLPNDYAGSEDSLTWLAQEVSPTITVGIMSQYFPAHKAKEIPELSRTLTKDEYAAAVDAVNRLGLENGWLQEMTAERHYRPHFDGDRHPFE
jgi:putative pyruvate formate lyase activating enzyme